METKRETKEELEWVEISTQAREVEQRVWQSLIGFLQDKIGISSTSELERGEQAKLTAKYGFSQADMSRLKSGQRGTFLMLCKYAIVERLPIESLLSELALYMVRQGSPGQRSPSAPARAPEAPAAPQELSYSKPPMGPWGKPRK